MVEHLRQKHPKLGITAKDLKCVKLAGLCHDLGHGPFSHIFDNEFMPAARPGQKWTHGWCNIIVEILLYIPKMEPETEQASEQMLEYLVKDNPDVRRLITDEEVRDEGSRMTHVFALHILTVVAFQLQFIKDLIHGEPRGDYPQSKKLYLFEIVANKRNSVDVDKFDYIQRDCHNVGLKSSVDAGRLLMASRVIDNEICYHEKDAMNLYELFHTRFSLFNRIYTHKVSKAIEYMVVDILLAADKYFKISQSVDNMEDYCQITDCLLREIERSKVPELEKARKILQRIRKRDLYRLADMVRFPLPRAPEKFRNEVITAQTIVEHQFEGDGLRESDVIVEWLRLNYAMGPRNPVDSISFFSKWESSKKFHIKRENISTLIPETFEETVLRVYTRDDRKRKQVQAAFRRLIAEVNQNDMLSQELGGTMEAGGGYESDAEDSIKLSQEDPPHDEEEERAFSTPENKANARCNLFATPNGSPHTPTRTPTRTPTGTPGRIKRSPMLEPSAATLPDYYPSRKRSRQE
ncbi:SAM domain and HD [Borealophlyctis nickersoniae]|nr:SAM domain and HD [Borealophlyctis nickersoniae]